MSFEYSQEMSDGGAAVCALPEAGKRGKSRRSNRNGNQKKPKVGLIALVALLLVGAVAGAAAVIWQSAARSDEAVIRVPGMAVLQKGFTDVAVLDEDSAIAAAAEGGEQLGFENALEELTCYISTNVDGQQFYRLQQHYEGFPVYGKYVMLVADESGEALSLISYAQDIPDTISLKARIDDRQAADAILEYAKFHWGAVYDDMQIPALSEDQLVIYDQDEEARLAYCLTVTNGEQYEVVVDARNAEVLSSRSMARTINNMSLVGWNVDQTESFPIMELTDASTGVQQYAIADTERNIYVHNMHGNNSHKFYAWENMDGWDKGQNVISVGNKVFGDTPEEIAQECDKAIALITTIGEIADYFSDSVNQSIPHGGIYLLYNDAYRANNAAGTAFEMLGKDWACIMVGTTLSCTEKSILAHEYTHCIQFEYDIVGESLESRAIMEGLADTFAAFCTDNWDMDLTVLGGTHRNAIDPTLYGYPKKITDTNSDDEHVYATVFSHAAYKMSQSGCFTENELEMLWYKAMILLPRESTFLNLRMCMERAAALCGYTEEQKAEIIRVFEEADINGSRVQKFGRDIELSVYNKEGNLYDDFDVSITGTVKKWLWFEEAYTGEYEAAEDGPVEISLQDGTYEVTVSDRAGGQKVVYNLEVAEDNKADTLYVLDFGADYEVAPGAALTVLDRYGDATSDYEAFAYAGTELVEITDGVIDLPVRNYYHFLLSDRSDFVTHYEFFSVWVKDGAATELIYQSNFYTDTASAVQVTDAFTDAFMIDDGIPRCYHVPKVESEVCEAFNASLYDTYCAQLESAVYSAVGYGEYPFVDCLNYTSGQNNDILSVVLHSAGWSSSYTVHNVSLVSGEEVSGDQVLYAYGMTEEEFRDLAAAALEQQWDATAEYMVATTPPESWMPSREQTLSAENLAAAVPFIGPDGSLCFKGDLFFPAGDGVVTQLYDARTGAVLDWTGCGGSHPEILRGQDPKPAVLITEEDAYERAYGFWDYNPDDAPEYSVALFGIEEHGGMAYYTFYLRQMITEEGQTWVTTLDIVYVNAVTGRCTYSPGG